MSLSVVSANVTTNGTVGLTSHQATGTFSLLRTHVVKEGRIPPPTFPPGFATDTDAPDPQHRDLLRRFAVPSPGLTFVVWTAHLWQARGVEDRRRSWTPPTARWRGRLGVSGLPAAGWGSPSGHPVDAPAFRPTRGGQSVSPLMDGSSRCRLRGRALLWERIQMALIGSYGSFPARTLFGGSGNGRSGKQNLRC